MKRLLPIGVILFVVCWGGVSISCAEQLPAPISKILNVFFDSLERGEFPPAYLTACRKTDNRCDDSSWLYEYRKAQYELGKILRRILKTVRNSKNFPGLFKETHMLLYFDASTEKNYQLEEILMLEQGQDQEDWLITSYAIRH